MMPKWMRPKWVQLAITLPIFVFLIWRAFIYKKFIVPPKAVEVIKEMPFLDLTLPEAEQEQRLEAYANTLNKTIYGMDEIKNGKLALEKGKQAFEVLQREQEWQLKEHRKEAENIRHKAWQSGFEEGYRKAVEQKW